MLEFILLAALLGVIYLWFQEKQGREETLEAYVGPILREHNNLRDGLDELHEAEDRAMRDMDEAVRNGR